MGTESGNSKGIGEVRSDYWIEKTVIRESEDYFRLCVNEAREEFLNKAKCIAKGWANTVFVVKP